MLVVFLGIALSRGGLSMGIDFVGGIKLRVKFSNAVDIGNVRSALSGEGLKAEVQQIGSADKHEYIISSKLLDDSGSTEATSSKIWNAITKQYPGAEELANDSVGPTIGVYLKKEAIKYSIIAVLLMMLYLAFRFEFKYSVGAMAALLHDLVLATLFCGIAGIEINTQVIAALLTIFGYSVNDTIVIFDRVRENVENETSPLFADVINIGISQSISRTLLTSLTTLFAVLALYLLGGDTINDFALVLLFGIFVGTYSSIYVASPVVLMLSKLRKAK